MPGQVDLGDGMASIGLRPFRFSHGVVGHPRLGREELADVAGRWPSLLLEHHLGDLPLLLPTGAAKQLPHGPAQVVRELDDNGCWVAIFNLEREPEYRSLLHDCLSQLSTLPAREGAMGAWSGHAFCAAPGAVVPVHFDRHHNLLLQIEGTKTVTIGRFDDPAVEQLEVEKGFASENATLVPTVIATYLLEPGDGLYIPPYAFHWVTNGASASVSFSCAFHTARSDRTEVVHACNVKLRRLGLRPRPPGGSDLRDAVKAALLRARRRVVTLRRRRKDPA